MEVGKVGGWDMEFGDCVWRVEYGVRVWMMEDECCRLVFGVWMLEFGVWNMEILGLMVDSEACGWMVMF